MICLVGGPKRSTGVLRLQDLAWLATLPCASSKPMNARPRWRGPSSSRVGSPVGPAPRTRTRTRTGNERLAP